MLIELRRPAAEAEVQRSGVALFRLGFRPFFLAAAAFAAFVVPLWLFVWSGHATLPAQLLPSAWHAHEMVFGFVVAVIAGFLLTAVRNWTSRPTPTGAALASLVALWALGRVALFLEGPIPHVVAALVDLAFLPALTIALARPIVQSRNWKNAVFLPLLLLLFTTNALFHFGSPVWAVRAPKIAIDVVLLIVVVIGGRVIPSFTASALRIDVRKHPALDAVALASLGAVALLGAVADGSRIYAVVSIAAGFFHALRLIGWRGWRAWRSPILWVLHVGYAWIAIGLVLRGVSGFFPTWIPSAATHALTVGAIGILILGMMSRVSLGHTGRLLVVTPLVTVAFGFLVLAAIVRAMGPLLFPEGYFAELVVAGTLWSAAFALFVFVYVPILGAPRVDGKPG
ncbi:NnrS family protein [soil metagenome]